jgi:hypothetical protein
VETQMRENHEIIFVIYQKNTFIGSTNFPILWLKLEGGYDPLFTSSNLKEATTQILWLQPEEGYNPLISKVYIVTSFYK